VMAFRGTVNIGGWMQDLNLDQGCLDFHRGSGCFVKVHKGFMQSLKNWIWDAGTPGKAQYDAFINKCRDEGRSIIFTGHSLGGAQTVMAAIKEMYNGYPLDRISIVNFGEPRWITTYEERVINELDSFLGERQTRYVNFQGGKVDLVPAIPPIFPNTRWHHGAPGYSIDEHGNLLFGGSNGDGRSDWPENFQGVNYKTDVGAHNINLYVANLLRVQQQQGRQVTAGDGSNRLLWVVGMAACGVAVLTWYGVYAKGKAYEALAGDDVQV